MTVILANRLMLDHHVILVKYCYETLTNVEIAADFLKMNYKHYLQVIGSEET